MAGKKPEGRSTALSPRAGSDCGCCLGTVLRFLWYKKSHKGFCGKGPHLHPQTLQFVAKPQELKNSDWRWFFPALVQARREAGSKESVRQFPAFLSPHLLQRVETRAPWAIFSCIWLIITHWEVSSHTNQP